MLLFRLRTSLSLSRTFANTSLYRERIYPVIPTCPPSTCGCAVTPELDIERTKNLENTIPPYTQHVLISTGQRDWTSRIEHEAGNSSWGQLIVDLKTELVKPNGSAYDYNNPIMITTSSFDPSPARPEPQSSSEKDKAKTRMSSSSTASMTLFPSFRYYPYLDLSTSSTLPNILEAIQTSVPKARIQNPPGGTPSGTLPYTPITTPTVLICSHNSRDTRCGILGPLLQQEFSTQLNNLGVATSTATFLPGTTKAPSVNVGCISHIGGHAWAGNVIIYLPRNTPHELAGTGVWYGRVEPKHVEGIARETVLGGRIIKELWRGGVGRDGMPMKLPS